MNGTGIKMIYKKKRLDSWKIYEIWRFLPVVDRGTLRDGYEVYDRSTNKYLWFSVSVVLDGIKLYNNNDQLRSSLEEEE